MWFQFFKGRHLEFYSVIPFSYAMLQQGRVHILFESRGHPPPLGYFAMGLVVVGIVIALLVIPVSRPITRRINQLRQSTLRIADGDLSHRVATSGKDEITELGISFNQMTAKLESMINNSKELTANISHELRTPLARMRVSEELLGQKLNQAGLSALTRHLDDIRDDVNALDALVGRILELSKLDMRAAPMVFEPLDLATLIHDIANKYQPAMDQRHLDLIVNLPERIAISGNREALCTAFSNLMDNAVDYTPENGSIRIEIVTLTQGTGITLTNTFRPLAEEELTKIFNPFQRIHQSGAAGSGLGLAIVKKIIEAHGGRIHAQNAKEGLAFAISLP